MLYSYDDIMHGMHSHFTCILISIYDLVLMMIHEKMEHFGDTRLSCEVYLLYLKVKGVIDSLC